MKHVLGSMSLPELLMHSIHAESTCLLQGHQVRILTYLYKKKLFFLSRFVLSIKSLNKQERQIVARYARLTPSCKARACTGQNSSMKNNKGH